MGNLSCSVSGLGAGDASRKSARGSTRTCQRRRATSSCCHYTDNTRLVGLLEASKGVAANDVVSAVSLEELLDGRRPGSPDLEPRDESAVYCVSPFTDAGSCDSGSECSGCFGDCRLEQLVTSMRDQPDDDDEDDEDRRHVLVMCGEDKAMMLLRTPSTICGQEWINWTALCPCCRRDASDDSIDLQEMIKLEPIRVRIQRSLSLRYYLDTIEHCFELFTAVKRLDG